jgi:prepilin-type N-terminal cleavage/methylation domain-containing protein
LPQFFTDSRSQAGVGLIEVLVALVLIGIMSLGIAANTIGAIQIAKKTETNYAASNLALSKVEQLSAFRVADLTSANSSVEDNISVPGMNTKFKCTTTVTVNSDQSRTIHVKVESVNAKIPTRVNFETTFSIWQ